MRLEIGDPSVWTHRERTYLKMARFKESYSRALHLHMRDIGRYSLVTPEEEVLLAQRARAGDLLARETLICANLRLVFAIAKIYNRTLRYSCRSLDFLDLVQVGHEALIRAVDGWDWSFGHKFSTYASFWIRGAISDHIGEYICVISVPAYVADHYWKVKIALNKLLSGTDGPRLIDRLAEATSLSVRDVKRVVDYAQMIPMSIDDAMERETLWVQQLSAKELGPEGRQIQRFVRARLLELVDTLGERKARILRLRFGFEDDEPRSLRAIADELGLSHERIRQIEKDALTALRIEYGAELREFLSMEFRC